MCLKPLQGEPSKLTRHLFPFAKSTAKIWHYKFYGIESYVWQMIPKSLSSIWSLLALIMAAIGSQLRPCYGRCLLHLNCTRTWWRLASEQQKLPWKILNTSLFKMEQVAEFIRLVLWLNGGHTVLSPKPLNCSLQHSSVKSDVWAGSPV